MRVGLIIYGSIDTITGGYIYDSHLVDYLESQGIVVKIFSQQQVHFLGLISQNFSKSLTEQITDFSPDILLQDEMNFVSLFVLNKRLKAIGKFPILSIVHLLNSYQCNNAIAKFFLKRIEKSYLKSVDGFIFNSFSTQKSVTDIIGKIQNSLVAHPGKDRFQFQITKDHITQKCISEEFMILFIGNLLPNKGLHILLEALSHIDTSLWRLSIAGNLQADVKYTNRILKMINEFNLSENINVLGLLDITNLKRELLSHHVLAVPSYYESYGMVYAEAMGAGLPIIACKSGGPPEIVVDKVNGFLVAPGDFLAVRTSIFTLIEDRDLLEKMSLASLKHYQRMSSWNETMKLVYGFLSRCLTNSGSIK